MTILSIEETNKKLLESRAIYQIPYSVFVKMWYDHLGNTNDEVNDEEIEQEWYRFASHYHGCKKHNDLQRFDDRMREPMRDDFTAYIGKRDYQFSAEDIDAENKILAVDEDDVRSLEPWND